MRHKKYPIEVKASPGFREQLRKEADPDWVVNDLRFLQWAEHRFSAQWQWGKVGDRFTTEMSMGGAEPSLEAIEHRVLDFLRTA